MRHSKWSRERTRQFECRIVWIRWDPSDHVWKFGTGGEDSEFPEDHILRWDSFEGRRKPAEGEEGERIGEVSSTFASKSPVSVFFASKRQVLAFNQNLQTFEVVIMANSWSVPQIECHGCKRECHIRDSE